MGNLKENQEIVVDAEGEGILGEFTFTSKPYDQALAAQDHDGQGQGDAEQAQREPDQTVDEVDEGAMPAVN